MRYWLFQVMYDWYPESWEAMVTRGVAAQHYPENLRTERRNIRELKRLRRGDKIIAAFRRHRFAGYATLTSGLLRGKGVLEVRLPNRDIMKFGELFRCAWRVVPGETGREFITCRDLKKKGRAVDLKRGLCVTETDASTFREIRSRLDAEGVVVGERYFQTLRSVGLDLESI